MRILLAEDDRRIASFVSKGLRENSYAVDTVNNGEEALYQVSICDYDLIILDVMMPLKDGFEVCQELRNSGNKTPILMLTARDAVEDRISGLDFGADDYLIKPFEFGEFLARLRALLRRQIGFRPPKIVIADLEIDTVSQKVWRGGNEILLTTKEYMLLEFMAREKGKVIGREEISMHVWDEKFNVFSNSIEVYVNRLRTKIDKDFTIQLIHTLRGAGYLLDDV